MMRWRDDGLDEFGRAIIILVVAILLLLFLVFALP